jgi:nicotinic acid mononucleotide adenylyltransferase
MGADQYAKLDTWHRPEDVRKLARIAVFARPGWKVESAKAKLIPFEPMKISASDIRARAARGEERAATSWCSTPRACPRCSSAW